MLLKFLGLADLTTALALLLSSILPGTFVMLMALYLLVKGGIFLLGGDKISSIDVLVAVYMLLAANGFTNPVVTAIAVLALIQKGGYSLLS